MLTKIAQLTPSQTFSWGLILALAILFITVVLRFGFDLQSTRDTAWLGTLTFGWRIHHGYPGLLLLAFPFFLERGWFLNACLILGVALILSDLVHHFVILQHINGDPEFHLRYSALSISEPYVDIEHEPLLYS